MSRRKQAKPRSLKPEDEEWTQKIPANNEMVGKEDKSEDALAEAVTDEKDNMEETDTVKFDEDVDASLKQENEDEADLHAITTVTSKLVITPQVPIPSLTSLKFIRLLKQKAVFRRDIPYSMMPAMRFYCGLTFFLQLRQRVWCYDCLAAPAPCFTTRLLAYLVPFAINLQQTPWTSNIYMLIRSQF
ncbi:unnamed protein product [Parnassius mnemosyne]|uniref:Uncharacterized protein n=1 Tax=Parnassius mnemosyne TaxID=213953 RepID=A0AAV1M5Z4_9NEOP